METIENSIQIIVDDSVSINDLLQKQAEGFSVMRSAHVGNLQPYNLSLAAAGIPMLLVDHNLTGKLDPDMKGVDRSYFPEAVKTQAGNQLIAAPGRLACRALVEQPVSLGITTAGPFVDQLHIAAIRHAIPKADIVTNTEYLRRNEAVAGEIIRLATEVLPRSFGRMVSEDGSVATTFNAAASAQVSGVLQLSDDPRAEKRAALVPNDVDILTNFVIEALKTERTTQFHLSGMDMVTYLVNEKNGILANVNRLYDAVRERTSFGARLPRKLKVHLVPSFAARFATTTQRATQLDQLLTALDEAEAGKAELVARKKAFFTSEQVRNRALRESFEGRARADQTALIDTVITTANELPELFTPPRTPGFVTQYDVLREGGLFVPPCNQQLSMGQLASRAKLLTDIRERRRL
ncbi:MAG TPA: hypothetical protein VG992_00905 [Candidatus Saccharimonadales bacterium]|nr:hypothetical protein [Candidatus Saccharimonadales bacterium]